MKLQCQVEVVNRLHSSQNIRSNGKYLKSTLALGKEPKHEKEFFILHFSTVNKTGVKYRVKNMKQAFVKCMNEGKVTLRFEEPPHDLCIKSEPIQLKCFMKLLQRCIEGKIKNLKISDLSNISVTAKDIASTKLVVKNRSEFPSNGLPRTLETLVLSGLGLCNFRRDILLLRQLTVLDLSSNEIEKLPHELGRMPNLAELRLANNKLGVKGDMDWGWIHGPQISNCLKLLDLSSNSLTHIPKSIWKLQKLVTLMVDNNLITEIPSSIGRLLCLRYLHISKNNLQSLPCSLKHCRLEVLDMSSNKFGILNNVECLPNSVPENPFSIWQFCIGNLVHLAAKTVLKNRIYYAPNIIPRTLVETLDNANICVCGTPVLNNKVCGQRMFDPKEFVRTIVADNSVCMITFECYFCSFKCFNDKLHKRRR